MRKHLHRLSAIAFAFVAAAAISTSAYAAQPEQSSDEAAMKGKDGKTTRYEFDDDTIGGEVLRPDGANLAMRGRNRAASLITIRPHFIAELIKLADDI